MGRTNFSISILFSQDFIDESSYSFIVRQCITTVFGSNALKKKEKQTIDCAIDVWNEETFKEISRRIY